MQQMEDLIGEFSQRPEVGSIALGGSRASGVYDAKSDYDVYIYVSRELDPDIRREILSKYCSYMEINNRYWETEDDCVLKSGPVIEILYRSLADFAAGVSRTVDEGLASNGYSTCMWDNLLRCVVLFDRNGELAALQKRYTVPYPKRLRQNIIDRNMKLLSGYIPSYYDQIKKASERMDIVSVNHRITEFLSSYFDVIFAYNEVAHPGEKRLAAQCRRLCESVPENFEEDLNNLLLHAYDRDILYAALDSMTANLKGMLA